MKSEEQIKSEVTKQIVEGARSQCNEEVAQVEKKMEDLYRTKIEHDVQDALEYAESGCTSSTPRIKDGENKKFQQQLANVRNEQQALEKKIRALDDIDSYNEV